MQKRNEHLLRLFTAGLVVAGYFALATTNDYSYQLLLLPLICLPLAPLAEQLDRRTSWYRQLTTHLTVACVVFVLLYIAAMALRVVPFDLLAPVTLLVMYIQIYELGHVKEERNYQHIYLMSFFMLVAAAVQSPEAAISFALLLFLVSSVGAFSMLQVCFRGSKGASNPEAAILPLRTSPAPRKSGKTPNRQGLGLPLTAISVAAVLVTTAIFFVTPRTEAGLLGRTEPGAFAVTGLDDIVEFGMGGTLNPDNTPTMRVTFPDEPGGQYDGPMLWRVATFDEYTGRSWTRRGIPHDFNDRLRDMEFDHVDDGVVVRSRTRPADSRVVDHVIQLEDHRTDWLPGLSKILTVHAPASAHVGWDPTKDLTVVSPARRGFQYEVSSEVYEPPAELLRETHADYLSVMSRTEFRDLTQHDLQPRTVALTEDIVSDLTNVYDMAARLEGWFESNQFIYSLEIPELPRTNAIDAFIHELRIGHCQLYATAMALMLRSQGVPTRVVSGYRGGEWDEDAEEYTVRANMAHLWVEVYFPDWGWVPFDPSPGGIVLDSASDRGLARLLASAQLQSRMFWYRSVLGYEPRFRLEQLFRGTPQGILGLLPNWFQGGGTGGMFRHLRLDGGPFVPILLAVFGLVGAYIWLTRQWRELQFFSGRPKTPLSRDQIRAIRLYMKTLRRLRRNGTDCRGLTVSEILDRAEAADGIDTAALAEILDSYSQARFGGRALDMERYRELNRRLRYLKAAPTGN